MIVLLTKPSSCRCHWLRGIGVYAMASRSLWDSELVAGVAFRPQRCQASKRGPWIDSTYMADVKLAYRLYKDTRQDSSGKALLIYFHANAELCTDLETDVHQFFDCGFGAVLCPEFRGYAWSEGTPSLRSLYPDSEVGAGRGDTLMSFGRS